jgi:Xaa-Pro aminopeptidase
MKQDLDRLMAERSLDAAVVMGSTFDSPTMYYLTGGASFEGATILLRPGRQPVLVHSPLEIDEAPLTGMETALATRWNLVEIIREQSGDRLAAKAEQLKRILGDYDVRGRVGFYGHGEIGQAHALLSALEKVLPETQVVAEFVDDMISTARSTKDPNEVRQMCDVAGRANQVVSEVADLLTSRPVSDNVLIAPGGEPLTVGGVKQFIHDECVKRGLEQPHGVIFALGPDAAVGHNTGNPDDVLALGVPIVFDFFPRPVGGGYFHDVTRTWCLGHAPDEVEQAFEQVQAAFDQVMAALAVGRRTADYQVMTCEYYESLGHPTILSNPTTQEGYVHGLGHGVGLEVHEAPSFLAAEGNKTTLLPGAVFTVEPGLYYRARGFGVRIEDVVYCDETGFFHSMTPFPKDLVLTMRS